MISKSAFAGSNNPNYKHGFAAENKKHPLYYTYYNMRARCRNSNHEKYHRYGGRGIKLCSEWDRKEEFFAWAVNSGWKKGLSLDRRDNDGHYSPENCQWIIIGLNSRKKSTTKLTIDEAQSIRVDFDYGCSMNKLAKHYGVTPGTIWFIVNDIAWDETLK